MMAVSAVLINATNSLAVELNTQIPMEQDKTFMVPVTLDIPRQQLESEIDKLGKAAIMNIAFPTDLVLGNKLY